MKGFAIATEPGFERVIDKLRDRAIAQKSNISAIVRDILYQDCNVKPLPKVTLQNRSRQLSRSRRGRR